MIIVLKNKNMWYTYISLEDMVVVIKNLLINVFGNLINKWC